MVILRDVTLVVCEALDRVENTEYDSLPVDAEVVVWSDAMETDRLMPGGVAWFGSECEKLDPRIVPLEEEAEDPPLGQLWT